MSKLTPRTKAALAVLPFCVGHDDKADAIAEAFAIVDAAIELDSGMSVSTLSNETNGSLNRILTALSASDEYSALRVIAKLTDHAHTAREALAAKSIAEGNEKTTKLAMQTLQGQVNSLQASTQAQGWDLANARQRIEELETLLRDARPAINSDASQDTIAEINARVDAMLGDTL